MHSTHIYYKHFNVLNFTYNTPVTHDGTSTAVSDWVSLSSSSDGNKLAVVSRNKGLLYTSNNSGVIWYLQKSGLPSQPFWVQIVSSSDGTKLAAVGLPISSSPGVRGYFAGLRK